MDLPGTKFENDTLDGLIVLISVSALHDSDDNIRVLHQKIVFSREEVVVVDSGDLVINAKAVLIIQQKFREDLLVHGSRETLNDLVTDIDITVSDLVAQANVNDVRRHETDELGSSPERSRGRL